MTAASGKLLVFLTEGPEGWDTPLADLAASCADVGQKAVEIDLSRPDASTRLNKAAGEGITAFVSIEGAGSRMTANSRSIFELLQAPLLTFLPDHPCFYAPLLTAPQKLVVPLFFSETQVAAARGLYGSVPLAPVIEPWGPRTLQLEGTAAPTVFVDAGTFELERALEREHPAVRELVAEIVAAIDPCPPACRASGASTVDPGDPFAEMDPVNPDEAGRPTGAGDPGDPCDLGLVFEPDVPGDPSPFAIYERTLQERWLPASAIPVAQRVRFLQLALALARAREVRAAVDGGHFLAAAGAGWPSALESRLRPLAGSEVPRFDASVPASAWSRHEYLRASRNLVRVGQAAARSGPVAALVRAAESSIFLDIALPGFRA